MQKFVIAAAVVLLIAVGIVVATRNDDNTGTTPGTDTTPGATNQSPDPSAQTNEADDNEQIDANTIVYTNSGFSPAMLTVAMGSTITIQNNSSVTLDFASDIHPSHLQNPELNVGIIEPGQSRSVTVSQQGTWGYHNHLNASDVGQIVVR